MRAVIYARYSTDLQREASIADQVRICRQRIEREGWTLIATYNDAATSGASRLRPGYQKLLEDARAGAFDPAAARLQAQQFRRERFTCELFAYLDAVMRPATAPARQAAWWRALRQDSGPGRGERKAVG